MDTYHLYRRTVDTPTHRSIYRRRKMLKDKRRSRAATVTGITIFCTLFTLK